MKKGIVETVIKKCLGHQEGERVLIICDDKTKTLAQDFYSRLSEQKIESVLLKMAPRRLHGEEPPQEVACALKAADIGLLLTTMSLSHTQARKQASRFGARIASLPGITEEILARSIDINYGLLKKKTQRLARRLTQGKK